MAYKFHNPNPEGKLVDDCVFRAIATVLDLDWEDVYAQISVLGLLHHDRPDANYVWGEFMVGFGFKRYVIPDTCPMCYRVRDFARDYPVGTFLLSTGNHVVAVKDGDWLDTWDSGDEVPVFFWQKES